ncbi:MAG: hydrogenase iron-sulfur subunit [Methanomassiliicoccales archaeon]|nr:MAG: hydrogenase iron-sulfur subunit [Methanomassiliicoccales archaeon]
MKRFEPVIVGFVCNECVYAAADLAGTTRLSYPSNIRLIRVPCSGQVDMTHILRAFENGADGVFVGGCLKEQCHYVDGNVKAEKRIHFLRETLKAMGIKEERLGIHFMSASMGREFANFAQELTSTIRKLGPSPLKGKTKTIHQNGKRAMLRDMLLSMAKKADVSKIDFSVVIEGFGETEIDKNKCIGCGACDYVCKDGAMAVEVKKDGLLIKNTYWKCTACRMCSDVCPKECLEVKDVFDLSRFLGGKEEIKTEVGMTQCENCGKSFLPLMLAQDIERFLSTKDRTGEFLDHCPKCRKLDQADRIRRTQGLAGKPMRVKSQKSSKRLTTKWVK